MILTPDQRLRVFISSTLDLTEARAAARRSVESLRITPVMFEAGARAHPPRALYRAYVEQSDVFVAIYSTRYGWVAPGMRISGLEDEFDLSENKPRLVYIEADVEREPELERFLERVGESGLSYRPFSTADELEQLLKDDLVILLSERFHSVEVGDTEPTFAGPATLPSPMTSFLGREQALSEIVGVLESDEVRLVTLIGPGGIGKTRLATEVARALSPGFPGGTYFVSLSALRESQLIAESIASALEVTTSDAYPALSAVENLIGDKQTLLVLDNFEQVIAGAATVSELLSACPRLKVIVTSRSPLRVRGEHEIEVTPLALPTSDVREDLEDCPAVRLFVESARAVRPGFELDEKSAKVVAEISRQLDGLPLAIELAAAATRVLTPEMLLERLRDRFADLRAGSRDMPERHQRLNDTIAWSYELLDEPTKETFAQLSVFRGGFTLEAAEQVCEVDEDLFTAVASLTEQSLVRADVRSGDVARFSMFTTIRQFAWQRLAESPHRDHVVANHAHFFVSLPEGMSRPEGRTPEALDKVEVELDNIRRAFEWLLEAGEPDPVGIAISESWWLWWWRGYLSEGRLWADRALAAPNLGREARAQALSARAIFAIWCREYDLAVPMFLEASEVAREVGDTRSLAYADIGLGLVRALTTSMEEGVKLIRRGTASLDEMGDAVGATTGLAAITWVQGITRQFEDTDETFRQTLERARAIGSDGDMGIAESALAQFRMSRGESDGVHDLIGSSLEHLARARHVGSTILTLEVVAELVMDAQPERAVRILAATAAIRSDMGTEVPQRAADRLVLLSEEGRERLGDRFDETHERGSRLSFTEVIDEGREALAALPARTP